ncbi:30S ribosomal protein S31, chloroplastic [Phalaenopsis equestris]|uniref:30S ribosomal protein S31, chloroplastic n=1 Tax=Phalaenopsis equestris TaxID=78828 RepID=UPI0009E6474C|nr:30S ribosomal protein S31, chloroplastic [Phalaenopsis equestris]
MAALLTLPMASLSLQIRSFPSPMSFSRSEAFSGTSVSFPSLLASSTASVPPPIHLVYCGRGDKKTAKGKRFKHSFGNARPRNKKKGRGPPRIPVPPSPPRKDRFDDGEKVKIVIDESLFS